MYSVQAEYRKLFDTIHATNSQTLFADILAPWVDSQAAEREWLHTFARLGENAIPPAGNEDLCRLYALGRVIETLLLRFQRERADRSDWSGPHILPEEYARFAELLGLAVTEVSQFSPFYHEIVDVDPVEDEWQPVTLVSRFWPCLMLGNMMFSRAGARVSGGKRFIDKHIAESSTMYWAYRRRNRPCQDLSHGWGSNSQWATAFRRDYLLGRTYYYNVDGKHDIGHESADEDRDDLNMEERIELLTNRCFITTPKEHGDLWPYDDRFQLAE